MIPTSQVKQTLVWGGDSVEDFKDDLKDPKIFPNRFIVASLILETRRLVHSCDDPEGLKKTVFM